MMRWLKRMFWKLRTKTPTVKDDLARVPNDSTYTPGDNSTTNFKLWYPLAENVHESSGYKMRSRDEYSNGYPEGLTIHWHSGWQLLKGFWMRPFPFLTPSTDKLKAMAREYALRCVKGGVKNGYLFFVMDVFGNIYQSRPLNKYGYHAGKSHHPVLGYNVSRKSTGIEVLNPGKLKLKNGKYFTWYNLEIPPEHIRHITEDIGNIKKGYYCMFTKEQETALVNFAAWLKENSPNISGEDVFKISNINGHDEVAPTRKTDPGGSLSLTIEQFKNVTRERVKMGVEV